MLSSSNPFVDRRRIRPPPPPPPSAAVAEAIDGSRILPRLLLRHRLPMQTLMLRSCQLVSEMRMSAKDRLYHWQQDRLIQRQRDGEIAGSSLQMLQPPIQLL